MENNVLNEIEIKKPQALFPVVLKYSIIFSFVIILYNVVLYAFNLNENKFLGWFVYVFFIAAMIIGSNKFKNENCDGYLSYGKSFLSSFLIGLFISIVISVWTYIFMEFIDKELVAKILEKAEESMLERNPNMSQNEINMGMKYVKMFTSPVMMSVMSLITNIIMSVIFALITAIFIKKEEPSIY